MLKKLKMQISRFAAAFVLTVAILANPLIAKSESPASKNREGNRLFTEGRYEEAEKAYLEAQVKSPGKPEILYNLGNSLIKQGKYPNGIQALRQSADAGDKRIETDSFYNTGNALYSMGDFKGSAESFIEALKLDPADKDAKHNLELALQKIQQQDQDQNQSNEKRDRQNPEGRENKQSPKSKGDQPQPNGEEDKQADAQNDRKDPEKMKPDAPVRREGSMTKEQAEQILDAVRNQELDEQRKKVESLSRSKTDKRDW
jgi:Ca-activated chloride channel homolog